MGMGAGGDRLRLAMCLRPEGRRAHVRHPNLNGPQPLRAQPLAMLAHLLPDGLGLRYGHHGHSQYLWLHVTYHAPTLKASFFLPGWERDRARNPSLSAWRAPTGAAAGGQGGRFSAPAHRLCPEGLTPARCPPPPPPAARRCLPLGGVLQPKPALPAERPLDTAASIAHDAGDVLADLLFEDGLPGHELEAEPVLHHGEASAGERGDTRKAAGDIFAGLAWGVGQAALGRHGLADTLHLAGLKPGDKVLRGANTAVVQSRGMALIDKALAAALHSVGDFAAEANFRKRCPVGRCQFPVEPGCAIAA